MHSGDITIEYLGQIMELKQGQSLLIPPETPFRISNQKTISTASVQYFIPDITSEIHKKLKVVKYPQLIVTDIIGNHIQELMNLYNKKKDISRIQELLLEIILEKILTSEMKELDDSWSVIINKYILMLPSSPSISEIASWSGYSESRFRVIFKETTGLCPRIFFNNLKMEKAALSLTETVLPIKKIASLHGYGEVSHFSRAFAKYFGTSPGRFRNKNKFRG